MIKDQVVENNIDLEEEITSELATMLDNSPTGIRQMTIQIADTLVEYRELLMMYSCAIKEVKTKFDVLNTEFNVRYQRNPINSISTRLKHTNSIAEKLAKKKLPFTLQNVEDYINDVAGIRVVCSYVDDIYGIVESLLQQDDITLIEKKDYIANPKPNGYRSLHLIVSVPVFFAAYKKPMKVEVQIRTIAMDFWASLEHQLKYKQDVPNHQEIVRQLRECADVIAATDEKMLDIRRQIQSASDVPTKEDILLEKLSKVDMRIS